MAGYKEDTKTYGQIPHGETVSVPREHEPNADGPKSVVAGTNRMNAPSVSQPREQTGSKPSSSISRRTSGGAPFSKK